MWSVVDLHKGHPPKYYQKHILQINLWGFVWYQYFSHKMGRGWVLVPNAGMYYYRKDKKQAWKGQIWCQSWKEEELGNCRPIGCNSILRNIPEQITKLYLSFRKLARNWIATVVDFSGRNSIKSIQFPLPKSNTLCG